MYYSCVCAQWLLLVIAAFFQLSACHFGREERKGIIGDDEWSGVGWSGAAALGLESDGFALEWCLDVVCAKHSMATAAVMVEGASGIKSSSGLLSASLPTGSIL